MKEAIKLGFIGFGYRGRYLCQLIQLIEAFQLRAIADPLLDRAEVERLQSFKPSAKQPALYTDGSTAYRQMLTREDLDLIFICTPWDLQLSIAEDCLQAHKHIALEIKGGLDLHEYDNLERLAIANECRVFPLENTLFMEEILSIKEMVRAGIFGNLLHLQGAYRHDLREMLLTDKPTDTAYWRKQYYLSTNGDLYPTHSFAPLCLIADNKPSNFTQLHAFASKSLGFSAKNSAFGAKVQTGDIVITQIKDDKGRLFSLTHDTSLPRPRGLEYEVQGTKAIWQYEYKRIYIDGLSPWETWEDATPYIKKYQHKYWTMWHDEALKIDDHHKGMDYVMLRAIEYDLLDKLRYPAELADLALWCKITPLSAQSIKTSAVVQF